jgi:phosphatidylserine/phosphatidylglycerophosphate/cardiolipin synthase-like enzyme
MQGSDDWEMEEEEAQPAPSPRTSFTRAQSQAATIQAMLARASADKASPPRINHPQIKPFCKDGLLQAMAQARQAG